MSLNIRFPELKHSCGTVEITEGSNTVFINVSIQTLSYLNLEWTDERKSFIKFTGPKNTRGKDKLIAQILTSILNKYINIEESLNGVVFFNITANNINLPLIGNALLLACLGSSIPIDDMFYCVGNNDNEIYVISDNQIILNYQEGPFIQINADKALERLPGLREELLNAFCEHNTFPE